MKRIAKNLYSNNGLHLANGLLRSATGCVKNLQSGPSLKDFLTNSVNSDSVEEGLDSCDPPPYISSTDINGKGRKGIPTYTRIPTYVLLFNNGLLCSVF